MSIRQTGAEFKLAPEGERTDLVEVQRYDPLEHYNVSKNVLAENLVPVFQGATILAPGLKGIVPAPGIGETNYFLRSDGVWAPGTGSTGYTTVSYNGTSLAPRSILDFSGAAVNVVDDALSQTTEVTFADNLNDLAGLIPVNGSVIVGTGAGFAAYNPDVQAIYVDATNGNDINSGSIIYPLATIQKAISMATGDPIDIFVYAGTYTENITLDGSTADIHITGFGDKKYAETRLKGSITINNTSGTCNISVTNMRIGDDVSVPVTVATASNVFFSDCRIQAQVATDDAVQVAGDCAFVEFCNCIIAGVFDNSTNYMGTVFVTRADSLSCKFNISSGNIQINDCLQIGKITHTGGIVSIRDVAYVAADSGVCLDSTALAGSFNSISLSHVNFQQSSGLYGAISKTGDCAYKVDNCNYDATTTWTGTRSNYTALALDVSGNYLPTNYQSVTDSVQGHLRGIDNALGNYIPFSWTVITADTTLEPNTGYIVSATSSVNLTLPANFSSGDEIRIVGYAGGWQIKQSAGQKMHWGSISTTTGTSGTIYSDTVYDCLDLVGVITNTEMVVVGAAGNLNIS